MVRAGKNRVANGVILIDACIGFLLGAFLSCYH